MDLPDTPAPAEGGADGGSRLGRRALGAGIVGVAATLLPQWRARVFATTPPDDTTSPDQGSTPPGGPDDTSTGTEVTVVPESPTPDETDGTGDVAPESSVTTTTEPTRRATDADRELLGFVQMVELEIVDLYDAALASGQLDESARVVLSTIREAHQAYGQGVGAILGQAAANSDGYELQGFAASDFTGSVEQIATKAYELEATAMATHIELIGALEATEPARLLASIVTIEARNCTVLADLAGMTDLDSLLLTNAEPIAMAAG